MDDHRRHLNTHASESSLTGSLNSGPEPTRWGKKMVRRHPGIDDHPARFLSDRSHRIPFRLPAEHSSWLQPDRIFFGILQRKCLRGGNLPRYPNLNLNSGIHQYYNATMAHHFTWTYTGKPLQKKRRPNSVHRLTPHHTAGATTTKILAAV